MGHSDEFKGQFTLDRPLDDLAILDILEDWNDGECKKYPDLNVDGYCQWIIKKDSDKKRTIITWDGNEKFYDPDIWIQEICKLLAKYGYKVNGKVGWNPDDNNDDYKIIVVVNNIVTIMTDTSYIECPECHHKFRLMESK